MRNRVFTAMEFIDLCLPLPLVQKLSRNSKHWTLDLSKSIVFFVMSQLLQLRLGILLNLWCHQHNCSSMRAEPKSQGWQRLVQNAFKFKVKFFLRCFVCFVQAGCFGDRCKALLRLLSTPPSAPRALPTLFERAQN